MDGAAVFVFSKDRKKLLLVKRRDVPIWVIPGGGIEENETPEVAAVREVKEESGYDVKIVRKVAEYKYKDKNKIDNIFEGMVLGGVSRLSNESKAVEFFYVNNLPEVRHPFIQGWLDDLNKSSITVIKREIEPIAIKYVLKQIHKHPILVIRFLLTRIGIRINL